MYDEVAEFLFWEAAGEAADALDALAELKAHKREQPIPPDVQKAMDDFRNWRT